MSVVSEDPRPRKRALLFVGGVRDAAMQLGVAHAMLVARSAPPDFVVGMSAGAVNAAAIAEILQAGPAKLSPEEQEKLPFDDRVPFQVDKLREFIDSYAEIPGTVMSTLLPDSLEVLAREPLEPLELPIHFDAEREAREVANEAKAGVVRLLNDIFKVKLSVGTGARIVRRVLGWVGAGEVPSPWNRLWKRVGNECGLLTLFVTHYPETSPLVAKICWAYIVGSNHTVLRLRRSSTADRLMKRAKRTTWNPLRATLKVLVVLHLYAAVAAGWLVSVLLRLLGLPFSRSEGRIRFAKVRSVFLAPWRWISGAFQPPFQRILGYYGLADGIANTDALKQLFVSCFDKNYYGRTTMTGVLNRSLDHNNQSAKATDLHRKRFSDYWSSYPKIHVAAVATALNEGKVRVIDSEVPVVDALLAATAVVPFFPAVRIDETYEGVRAKEARHHQVLERKAEEKREREWYVAKEEERRARQKGGTAPVVSKEEEKEKEEESHAPRGGQWFINGGNLSSEAIGPLMNYLRDTLVDENDQSAGVDVYRASALPISSTHLPVKDSFDGVLDVLPRALQLKQFRDATVEQQLTHLYTRTLPKGRSIFKNLATGEHYVNATVYPLELENAANLESRLLAGEKVEYRELLYETIADGCRATIETTMPALVREKAAGMKTVSCRGVIEARRNGKPRLPGGDDETGPGISEVCQRCALYRERSGGHRKATTLRVSAKSADGPDWPVVDRDFPVAPQPVPPDKPLKIKLGDWPQRRADMDGKTRPTVSLLFGGGVFRGVFHMGVMTALNEVGVYPDVVAGSSVGSIIAAMIAQVFSDPISRQRQMAHLAATFLSIDQLILTDRFADFIRRLTLHAADTRFSPRDLDLLFRRYDDDDSARFNRRSRDVSAGIERLLNVSPFELFALARDLRLARFSNFLQEVKADIQSFLDHGGVPKEILGAEPLSLLIRNHVLCGRRADNPADDDLFESFRDCGIYFLATTTNLNSGELEILGTETLASDTKPSLLYGLLASSAFPAIFRPRQSWEIFRRTVHVDQYIDGGVIDNLPLHAVARFLDRASRTKLKPIARRPMQNGKSIPHLLFTASLEVDPSDRSDVDAKVRDCIELWKYSRTLKYNRKIDAFARAQRDLRAIHEQWPAEDPPVDLHVMAVKPKWLCGTFGFHPMLGFRRRKQAQSIAHGCATTLAAMYQFENASDGPPERKDWLKAWGVSKKTDFDPSSFRFVDRKGDPAAGPKTDNICELEPRRAPADGRCWFRTESKCPYSNVRPDPDRHDGELDKAGVAEQKISEIERIYELCGMAATHRAQGG
jgi:predicted acylesterase/phospholipase RssA